MATTISAQSRACIANFQSIISNFRILGDRQGVKFNERIVDEFDRFTLWVGNIGALHLPQKSLSLEFRLAEDEEILEHVRQVLQEINDATHDLLDIVAGRREEHTMNASGLNPNDFFPDEDQNEATELLKEVRSCITHLIRVSTLIRKSTSTDPFEKALRRERYHFDDRFDIAHVGEKFPKLATESTKWLRRRLGQAITLRRAYLSYSQDHQNKLREALHIEESHMNLATPISENRATEHNVPEYSGSEMNSQPATFVTDASTFNAENVDIKSLDVRKDSSSGSDTNTRSTVSHSPNLDLDDSAKSKIPKLEKLKRGSKEIECPYCFRIKRIKNERSWYRHVMFDLRAYICTSPGCISPLFRDVHEWFRHEMRNHRSRYICRFCPKEKPFEIPDSYLQHIQKFHPDIPGVLGDQSVMINVARQPLTYIPARECPFCDEWSQKLSTDLRRSAGVVDNVSDDEVLVDPRKFRQHVAAHLEQLTLFAVSMAADGEEDGLSDLAVEKNPNGSRRGSDLSDLTFESPGISKMEAETPEIDERSESDRNYCCICKDSSSSNLVACGNTACLPGWFHTSCTSPTKSDILKAVVFCSNECRRVFEETDTHDKRNTALLHDTHDLVDNAKASERKSTEEQEKDEQATFEPQNIDTRSDSPAPWIQPSLTEDPLGTPTSTPSTPDGYEFWLEDDVPYPHFLRQSHVEQSLKWNRLEFAQMERLRDTAEAQQSDETYQFNRCNNEAFAPRNRYANVHPYLSNRVKLEVPEGYLDYINASPILLKKTRSRGLLKYIATQGPTFNTIGHLWRMVRQQGSSPSVIVMLTQTHETGREKCFPYYPMGMDDPTLQINEHDEFHDSFIHTLKLVSVAEDERLRTTIREIHMIHDQMPNSEPGNSQEPFKVWHLLFSGWPDFSVPEGDDQQALVDLTTFSREKLGNHPDGLRFIHCSAGIGRTGTFIALDYLLQELEDGAFDDIDQHDDPIKTCVETLRDQRSGMVQSKAQFTFLYHVLREKWAERWHNMNPTAANQPNSGQTSSSLEDPHPKRRKTSSATGSRED